MIMQHVKHRSELFHINVLGMRDPFPQTIVGTFAQT